MRWEESGQGLEEGVKSLWKWILFLHPSLLPWHFKWNCRGSYLSVERINNVTLDMGQRGDTPGHRRLHWHSEKIFNWIYVILSHVPPTLRKERYFINFNYEDAFTFDQLSDRARVDLISYPIVHWLDTETGFGATCHQSFIAAETKSSTKTTYPLS